MDRVLERERDICDRHVCPLVICDFFSLCFINCEESQFSCSEEILFCVFLFSFFRKVSLGIYTYVYSYITPFLWKNIWHFHHILLILNSFFYFHKSNWLAWQKSSKSLIWFGWFYSKEHVSNFSMWIWGRFKVLDPNILMMCELRINYAKLLNSTLSINLGF